MGVGSNGTICSDGIEMECSCEGYWYPASSGAYNGTSCSSYKLFGKEGMNVSIHISELMSLPLSALSEKESRHFMVGIHPNKLAPSDPRVRELSPLPRNPDGWQSVSRDVEYLNQLYGLVGGLCQTKE